MSAGAANPIAALRLALLAILLAAAPARAEKAEKVPRDPSLFPDDEEQRMGPHPVDRGAISYIPGKGLRIDSADGDFRIEPQLRAQLLVTHQDGPQSERELGLLVRRARLQFVGYAFGKHNKYKVELAFSPRDLRIDEEDGLRNVRESPLLSWYFEFDQLRDLSVRAGQYKIPFSRQRVTSSGKQQLVDRSIANGEFNLDRDIGIDIRSKDFLGLGRIRYYAGVYNGEGRSSFENGDANLMFLGRVEYLPFGFFNDYSEADLERLERPGLSLGFAFAHAHKATGSRVNQGRPADGGTTDYSTLVADATFKYAGLSLSSEFFWRDGSRNPGDQVDETGTPIPTEEARNGLGWFAQAGYLLPRSRWEIATRYGQVIAADTSSIEDQHELGLAVSYYFAGHPLKLQADTFQLWGNDFADGDTRLRLQLQLSL